MLLGRRHEDPGATTHAPTQLHKERLHMFTLVPTAPDLSMHILTPWDFNLDLETYYHVIARY